MALRSAGELYVDKTGAFVARVLASSARALLFCRPRRFGKTLNMTTLRAFVEAVPGEAPDAEDVDTVRRAFAGLAIEHAGPDVWRHYRAHPVIWLSLKDIKGLTWADVGADLAAALRTELLRHLPVLRGTLAPEIQPELDALCGMTSLESAHRSLLRRLSQWLHEATGQKPIVLIDEYDTPIHSAFEHGYLEEALTFFRSFLGAGLKDNPHVERSVLTGILRVAKESVFSGLNHLQVYTLLADPDEPAYADAFGFTQAEVDALCDQAELGGDVREAMKAMYNGYRLGGLDLYSPWSLLQCLASTNRRVRPYWVNTADNAIIRELLIDQGVLDAHTLEALLRGESVIATVDEHTVLRDVAHRPEALLSFLVLAGYLQLEDGATWLDWRLQARVRAPNREVLLALRGLAETGLGRPSAGAASTVLSRAILAGDASLTEAQLQALLQQVLSYHLTGGRAPERVYQAFVAGLLVVLDASHEVATELETGLGRADVLVSPRRPGLPGVAMELKVGGDLALEAALDQLRTRDYGARLRAAGAAPVRLMAAAFDGKQVRVAFAEG